MFNCLHLIELLIFIIFKMLRNGVYKIPYSLTVNSQMKDFFACFHIQVVGSAFTLICNCSELTPFSLFLD